MNFKGEKKTVFTFSILAIITLLSFILTKIKILSLTRGLGTILVVYLFAIFEIQEYLFYSRRVKFLLYLFTILDVLMFMICDFSLMRIGIYLLGLLILAYFTMKIEGKKKINNIKKYIGINILFKIIFLILMLFI